MQQLYDFLEQQPFLVSILRLLFWILIIIVGIGFLRKIARNRIDNVGFRYKTQKGIEVVGYVMIVILFLVFFTAGNIKDYSLIIGLFTAGITFTLQELILSIAGSFYIFAVRVYTPGDRIEINGIKGDVIDIDSIYTTIMEMGEWVSSDNYSGRIVKISNAFVFKGPIKNYSMDFPFVWDELDILVTYSSDVELAKKIVLDTSNELLSAYAEGSKSKWAELVERYYIENALLEPTIAIKLTDNWIVLNVRYITDFKLRRGTKHKLFDSIQKHILQTDGKVTLASATLQLLKIPEVDVRIHDNL
ncbi:mechanosensitive ion channel family protein [Sediminicola sp. 1XM1-17]|uniref:mechanosensitive ion channel family protein n=1 Tax=Sediminicola sp. 1XM1-17 TaxID=3127702 RepID=UPI003077814A